MKTKTIHPWIITLDKTKATITLDNGDGEPVTAQYTNQESAESAYNALKVRGDIFPLLMRMLL